jgi:hypothetical protein
MCSSSARGCYLAFLVYLYYARPKASTPELQQEHFRGWCDGDDLVLTALPILWALGADARRHRLELELARASTGDAADCAPQARLGQELSLFSRPNIAPRWRTNGISCPAIASAGSGCATATGAMLYLTDPSRVTRLPTRAGFVAGAVDRCAACARGWRLRSATQRG